MTDNFGLGKRTKIERNDGKVLCIKTSPIDIEEYTHENREFKEIKTPESYGLLCYLLLTWPGRTALPTVFP